MNRPAIALWFATFALAAVAPVAAQAHALLKLAEPRVGGVVTAPRTIRLKFTEAVEVPFCRVSVTGPRGFGGAGAPRAVAGDPGSLVVDLKGSAPPGAYVVRWRVIAADTHVSQGDFSFRVRP